jgi:thioredoxin reductase
MDYLIIGAGPAGLQLGYFLKEAGLDYLILESGSSAGSFFESCPRHRQLISINKPHTGCDDPEVNLRMDWNSLLCEDPELRFTRYSSRYFPPADEMVRYLRDFAEKNALRIQYDSRIQRVTRTGAFHVTDENGRTYSAKQLIVATGVSKPYIPAIPGIEFAENYATMSTDPAEFLNQRVLILGKGNSAFETADGLIETAAVIHVAGPSAIRFAWRTHYVGHLRAVNNNFLDSYQLKSQNALLDGNVLAIERDGDGYIVTFSFSRANEVVKSLRYDRVLVCTGFRFDPEMFDESCRPSLTIRDRFPAQTSEWESVNVPGLHFAGTLMQARDFKKSTGGFIHGFRYGVRALARILEKKYEQCAWPYRTLEADPEQMMQAVLSRVNRTSGLWQQFAFLCDLIEVNGEGDARYREELPVDYVQDSDLVEGTGYFTITLEYGPNHDSIDPFDIDIVRVAQNEAGTAHESVYLHPVIRHYSRGELLATHHVAENLENEWTGPAHREPLTAFFAHALAHTASHPVLAGDKEPGVWVG